MHDKTCIPSNVRVYHKTGTVYGLVGDSGILAIIDFAGKTAGLHLYWHDRRPDQDQQSQPFRSVLVMGGTPIQYITARIRSSL